jgi:hypothetical protein
MYIYMHLNSIFVGDSLNVFIESIMSTNLKCNVMLMEDYEIG